MDQNNNPKGFTIAELVVVGVIMGLLATMAIVAMRPGYQKTRDARRRADLDTLKKAFEWYVYDNGNYPAWAAGGCIEKVTAGGNPFLIGGGFIGQWIAKVPKDPLYGKGYCYYYKTKFNETKPQNYHLIANLESEIEKASNDGGILPEPYYEVFAAGGALLSDIGATVSSTVAVMSGN